PRWLAVAITFHFVTLAWVFFRAPDVGRALQMFRASMAGEEWAGVIAFAGPNVFVLFLISIFFLVHRYDDHRRVRLAVRHLRPEVFWPIVILLWIVAVTVSQGSSPKFIY